MDQNAAWQVIHQERAALADLLETLAPDEWDQPSLCAGWTVRDVAAHLSMAPEYNLRRIVAAAIRARGNYNRMVHDEAERGSRRPTEEIVADFRRLDGSRRVPAVVTYREALLDILVHTQDIMIPLGRHRDMPIEAARESAARVWRVGFPFYGFPFFARRTLSGCRLEATDIDWAVGEGDLVRGPVSGLLLLVTGRPAALSRLSGIGADRLRGQLEVPS